jgi:phage tail-like protein
MALAQGDPVATRLFGIEIDGVTIAQFREVTGIANTIAVIEHRENTPKGEPVLRKLPGNASAGDITLRRGKTADKGMWQWFKQVRDGDIAGARRNGSVILYDYERGEVARYNFRNGWPSKLNITNLAAPGTDVVIEECVISHEGLDMA